MTSSNTDWDSGLVVRLPLTYPLLPKPLETLTGHPRTILRKVKLLLCEKTDGEEAAWEAELMQI